MNQYYSQQQTPPSLQPRHIFRHNTIVHNHRKHDHPQLFKQQLLDRYQRQLQQLLMNTKVVARSKRQKQITTKKVPKKQQTEPIASNLYLGWQREPSQSPDPLNTLSCMTRPIIGTAKKSQKIHRTLESSSTQKDDSPLLPQLHYRTYQSPVSAMFPSALETNNFPSSNRKNNFRLRKSDELIITRYNTQTFSESKTKKFTDQSENHHSLPTKKFIVSRRQRASMHLIGSIDVRTNASPRDSQDNNTTNTQRATQKICLNKPEKPSTTRLGCQENLQESQTRTNFRSERPYARQMRYMLNLNKLEEESKSKDSSEYQQIRPETPEARNTVFFNKARVQSSIQYIKNSIPGKNSTLTSLPSKEDLPVFVTNYEPLDPSFNLLQLTKQSQFAILAGPEFLYLGEVIEKDNGKKQRQGRGVYLTKHCHFQGIFENNQKREGVEKGEEGVYKGKFSNNLRNGKGEYRWTNGEYYNGEWKDNKKHGSGIWASSSYAGEQNSMPDSYMGEWKEGKVHGYGVHVWNNGKNRYEGEFIQFLKHGMGVEKFENSDKYEGNYVNGKAEGYGEYYWADGTVYKGQFKGGLRDGPGIETYPDETRFEGYFKKDLKHGRGKIIYTKAQATFSGDFMANMKEGEGVMVYRNGEAVRGIWKNNKMITKIEESSPQDKMNGILVDEDDRGQQI